MLASSLFVMLLFVTVQDGLPTVVQDGLPAGTMPTWLSAVVSVVTLIIGTLIPTIVSYLLKRQENRTTAKKVDREQGLVEDKTAIGEYRRIVRITEVRMNRLEAKIESNEKEMGEIRTREVECLQLNSRLQLRNGQLTYRVESLEKALRSHGIKFEVVDDDEEEEEDGASGGGI